MRKRPNGSWWYDLEPETAREIHHTDRDDFTGLYNHLGEPLYRQREPFGFDPNRWNDSMKKTAKRKGKSRGC